MPGPISFREIEVNEQGTEQIKKPGEVSMRKLAYLNKPKLLVVLVRPIATTLYGITLPVFGLSLSIAVNIFYEPLDELKENSKYWTLVYAGIGFSVN